MRSDSLKPIGQALLCLKALQEFKCEAESWNPGYETQKYTGVHPTYRYVIALPYLDVVRSGKLSVYPCMSWGPRKSFSAIARCERKTHLDNLADTQ